MSNQFEHKARARQLKQEKGKPPLVSSATVLDQIKHFPMFRKPNYRLKKRSPPPGFQSTKLDSRSRRGIKSYHHHHTADYSETYPTLTTLLLRTHQLPLANVVISLCSSLLCFDFMCSNILSCICGISISNERKINK